MSFELIIVSALILIAIAVYLIPRIVGRKKPIMVYLDNDLPSWAEEMNDKAGVTFSDTDGVTFAKAPRNDQKIELIPKESKYVKFMRNWLRMMDWAGIVIVPENTKYEMTDLETGETHSFDPQNDKLIDQSKDKE